MVAMRSCKYCRVRYPLDKMISHPIGLFHSQDCVIDYAKEYSSLSNKKLYLKKQNEFKQKQRDEKKNRILRKKQLKKRTGKNGYYDNLKTELHYYVKHVLRPNEPCYTCGKQRDQSKSFHVGHYIPAKSVDPRRFLLENLRIQCYTCNCAKSGERVKYRNNLIEEMGLEHVEWLECENNFTPLIEKFPDIEDIRQETSRYRKINNDHRE